ncbi:MAG: stage II sporulation protein M [Terriglobales bacterium]
MISTYWLEKRKPYWERLEALLADATKIGPRGLHRSGLRELGLLYRQTATDLSALREDPGSQHYARYLNQLLGRAHNIIYTGKKSTPLSIVNFFRYEYPAIFRRFLPYTALAFVLFVVGGVVGTVITVTNPAFMRAFLGPQMVETIEKREMWTHSVVAMKPLAASGIMTNNLSVSFMSFASGIIFGLGTLYMATFNGVLMGVIGAACWMAGMSLKLWSFVAPHGVLELPAIFIACGAGFRLAEGLLFPGVLPRRDSLAVAGADAVRLLVGVIPMLLVAGTIEGFFSPTNAPVWSKFAVAAALFTMLVAYLSSGRKRHTAETEQPWSK